MDKDLLFKPRLPEDKVDVEGLGTFTVRGLSRIEAIHVAEAKGTDAFERRLLSLGLVDPALTEDEVTLWRKAAPAGEIDPVSQRIAELSGMAQESAKDAYKSIRPEPGE